MMLVTSSMVTLLAVPLNLFQVIFITMVTIIVVWNKIQTSTLLVSFKVELLHLTITQSDIRIHRIVPKMVKIHIQVRAIHNIQINIDCGDVQLCEQPVSIFELSPLPLGIRYQSDRFSKNVWDACPCHGNLKDPTCMTVVHKKMVQRCF